MPREIDGLVIDDTKHPKDYKGPFLFTDPDAGVKSPTARPFPYRPTEQVSVRHLTTTSGQKPRISVFRLSIVRSTGNAGSSVQGNPCLSARRFLHRGIPSGGR